MRTHWLVPRSATRRAFPALSLPARHLASFDRIFDDVWRSIERSPVPSFAPKIDVEESDDELRLTAELPGLDETDFEVTIDGDRLTLTGEKKPEREAEDEDRRWSERSSGSFQRSFRLAWEVDPEGVKASYRNGVLEIVIPKPEEVQPQARTIPVTSSH